MVGTLHPKPGLQGHAVYVGAKSVVVEANVFAVLIHLRRVVGVGPGLQYPPLSLHPKHVPLILMAPGLQVHSA